MTPRDDKQQGCTDRESNEEIFNALVEKLEILTPTHFVIEANLHEKVFTDFY